MFRRIIQSTIFNLAKKLTHWFTEVEVIGLENMPNSGPVLLVMNHFSIFDIPVIVFNLTPKLPIFFAANALHADLYARPILWAFRENYIIVNRGKIDRDMLKQGLETLSRDEFVVIMPEGGVDEVVMPMSINGVPRAYWPPPTNSRQSGQLMAGRTGSAYIAAKAQVPILPLGAAGIQYVEGNIGKLKRTKITVRVGKPFMLDSIEELRGQKRKERLSADTHRIMQEIAQLLPPENRGVYSG